MTARSRALLALVSMLAVLMVACRQHDTSQSIPESNPSDSARTDLVRVAPPLSLNSTAYELAGAKPLPGEKPLLSQSRIYNLQMLSPRIFSGAEPMEAGALEELAERGIKTLISVDGKSPDAAGAERLGMRYVHIPIRYSTITGPEIMRLSKTFRELEAPFFVHCFHGKHRGPAGAALGRVVLDGEDRERAIAEMRQWMGTSRKYEGLYSTIASAPLPTEAETAAYPWNFPAEFEFEGFRPVMVELARISDNLGYLMETNWGPNPDHPDLDRGEEATRYRELLEDSLKEHETNGKTAWKTQQFHDWLTESITDAKTLEAMLRGAAKGTQPDAAKADALYERIEENCSACHAQFRNH